MKCIEKEKVCDGMADSINNKDEIGCNACICKVIPKENQLLCPATCIIKHRSVVCDGDLDCPQGLDEANCTGKC